MIRKFFVPNWKALVGVVVVLIAGNVAGKILAPNGPSGDVRGVVGSIGMFLFFVLLAYLVVVAIVALVRLIVRAVEKRQTRSANV